MRADAGAAGVSLVNGLCGRSRSTGQFDVEAGTDRTASGDGTVTSGGALAATAMPGAGYRVSGWSGDSTSISTSVYIDEESMFIAVNL